MGQMHKISRNNTTVTRHDGTVVVTLHSTDVVKVSLDKTVTLDTGGWCTVTTKARMNQAATELGLGFRVFAEKGNWFVRVFETTPNNFEFGHTIPFDDRTISFQSLTA
jgi:hypothetical protein